MPIEHFIVKSSILAICLRHFLKSGFSRELIYFDFMKMQTPLKFQWMRRTRQYRCITHLETSMYCLKLAPRAAVDLNEAKKNVSVLTFIKESLGKRTP